MVKREMLPYSLKHTLGHEGETFGPQTDAPTPVGLIRKILLMEGKSKKKADEIIEELRKSVKDTDPFDKIPHKEELLNHSPPLDSVSKVVEFGVDNLSDKVTGIGKVGEDKIRKFISPDTE